MADALDTVNKLMALALNNPNVEEARSAALKAVQMIREHKLVVARQGGLQYLAPAGNQQSAYDMFTQQMYEQAQRAAKRQQQRSPIYYEQYWTAPERDK
jgi:hypothetical protein